MKKKSANQPIRRTGANARKALPPLSDVEAAERGIKVDRDGYVRCRVCGCTELQACFPPCSWVHSEADLCSGCYTASRFLCEWKEGAHRPSMAALLREVARMRAAEGTRHVRRAV